MLHVVYESLAVISAHLPSINRDSQKGSLLTQFDLLRRCESIYKKVPVVTFFVMESHLLFSFSQNFALSKVAI